MKKLIIGVLLFFTVASCDRPTEPYLEKINKDSLDNEVVMDKDGDMYVLKWDGYSHYIAYKVDTAKVAVMLKQITK